MRRRRQVMWCSSLWWCSIVGSGCERTTWLATKRRLGSANRPPVVAGRVPIRGACRIGEPHIPVDGVKALQRAHPQVEATGGVLASHLLVCTLSATKTDEMPQRHCTLATAHRFRFSRTGQVRSLARKPRRHECVILKSETGQVCGSGCRCACLPIGPPDCCLSQFNWRDEDAARTGRERKRGEGAAWPPPPRPAAPWPRPRRRKPHH